MKFILHPGQLTLTEMRHLLNEHTSIELHPDCYEQIHASEHVVKKIIHDEKIVYGINTGFGALANKIIQKSDLQTLQRCIVFSHAAGTGALLSDDIVRMIFLLKINSLARGFSGVRLQTIEALIQLFNAHIYPCIPSQGSVGASGDLAPLAHLALTLIGEGNVRYQGKIIQACEALDLIKLKPIELAPKEGLALLNGTQVSTALALIAWFQTEELFNAALVSWALSVEAARGSYQPFD